MVSPAFLAEDLAHVAPVIVPIIVPIKVVAFVPWEVAAFIFSPSRVPHWYVDILQFYGEGLELL